MSKRQSETIPRILGTVAFSVVLMMLYGVIQPALVVVELRPAIFFSVNKAVKFCMAALSSAVFGTVVYGILDLYFSHNYYFVQLKAEYEKTQRRILGQDKGINSLYPGWYLFISQDLPLILGMCTSGVLALSLLGMIQVGKINPALEWPIAFILNLPNLFIALVLFCTFQGFYHGSHWLLNNIVNRTWLVSRYSSLRHIPSSTSFASVVAASGGVSPGSGRLLRQGQDNNVTYAPTTPGSSRRRA